LCLRGGSRGKGKEEETKTGEEREPGYQCVRILLWGRGGGFHGNRGGEEKGEGSLKREKQVCKFTPTEKNTLITITQRREFMDRRGVRELALKQKHTST